MELQFAINKHQQSFQNPNNMLFVKSPGRVNLLGEHTDYNMGYSLPFAFDKHFGFFIQKNNKNSINILHLDYDQNCSFDLSQPLDIIPNHWTRYIISVLIHLKASNMLSSGYDISLYSDIPIGAGLSSSTAMTCGFYHAVLRMQNIEIPIMDFIKSASKIENMTAVEGGLLDHIAIVQSQKDKILFIDYLNHKVEKKDFDTKPYQLWLCNSQLSHNLVDTPYMERRAACFRGVEILNQLGFQGDYLRNFDIDMLHHLDKILSPKQLEMCRFVIEENNRCLDCFHKIKSLDWYGIGNLLNQTHSGLSEKYLVSTPEIDFLWAKITKQSTVLGARLMGGGFGGCLLVLADKNFGSEQRQFIDDQYYTHYGIKSQWIAIEPSEGLSSEYVN